ncbi:MAG: hypothetical protein J5501_11255 [Ruminococcus sp.]|nr:hypothetical protein [Ruminococcus sp.]
MEQLINNYITSCRLAKERIGELTRREKELGRSGSLTEAEKLDLDRRIKMLYVEHGQMMEVVNYLTGYLRRVEQRAEI